MLSSMCFSFCSDLPAFEMFYTMLNILAELEKNAGTEVSMNLLFKINITCMGTCSKDNVWCTFDRLVFLTYLITQHSTGLDFLDFFHIRYTLSIVI